MRNRRRQRMHPNRLRNFILWAGLIIAPLLLILLWDDAENLIKNSQPKNTATQEPLHVEDVNTPMFNRHHLMENQKDGKSSLRVYPYSVVDGGVHSVQELRSAISWDPVVAKHYSNFKLDRARVIEAKAERHFHVSYRIGDEIFWTKKRLKVARGERLITDGAHFTRTRCANVLSEVPKWKTSPDEPTAEVFDTPTLSPRGSSPSTPPVVIAGGFPGPAGGGGDRDGERVFSDPGPGPGSDPDLGPDLGPSPGSGPGSGDPGLLPGPFSGPVPGPSPDPVLGPSINSVPDPVPVPEPTTMLLLGSGLAGLWGLRRKFKK
jgi:PEP-CTERM motif